MLGSSQHTRKPPNRSEIRFREPRPTDGAGLWAMAGDAGLDLNSPYAYVMWADHFASSSLVATDGDGQLGGFVIAFRSPAKPEVVFVWQIAVARAMRGRGLASLLLDELVARLGASVLEATVTPSNQASIALFTSFAARHGVAAELAVAYPAELFPAAHEEEVRYRIGPLATRR